MEIIGRAVTYIFVVVGMMTEVYTRPQYDKVDQSKLVKIPQHSRDIYSGYLNISSFEKSAFYMFVESESDQNDDKIPVVLWLGNGPSPRCSSLAAMFYYNGPHTFSEGSDELKPNQFAWTKHAHMLYLQSPIGVGFSQGFTQEALNSTDTSTNQDNYLALLQFFEKYPELIPNQFYIAGEGYGGVFIPKLAQKIIQNNKLDPVITINLKGIMVGNGCTQRQQYFYSNISRYQVQFLYWRGFIDRQTYQQHQTQCIQSQQMKQCSETKNKIQQQFKNSFLDIKNIYRQCKFQSDFKFKNNPSINQIMYLKCLDRSGIENLLNIMENQKAFNVIEDNDTISWNMCSSRVNYTRERFQPYFSFDDIKGEIRMTYYSGDFDALVPVQGSLAFIDRLRKTKGMAIKKNWEPWTSKSDSNEQILNGMVWQLQGLSYYMVTGAGHRVLEDKPSEVKIILNKLMGISQQNRSVQLQ